MNPRTHVVGADHGPKVIGQDIYEARDSQVHPLGERLVLGDRVFKYAEAGAVDLVAGFVVGSPAAMLSEDVVTVAHGIGSFEVVVTGSATANQYAGGYLTVDEGTGVGETYKIKHNTATSGTTFKVTLFDPLATAWSTTDTDITLVPSMYAGGIVCPTDVVVQPVGVPLIRIPANQFGWLQTWGICGVRIAVAAGNTRENRMLYLSDATAGGVQPCETVANATTGVITLRSPFVGEALLDSAANNAGKIEPIFLKLSS